MVKTDIAVFETVKACRKALRAVMELACASPVYRPDDRNRDICPVEVYARVQALRVSVAQGLLQVPRD
jgi:hypothetical protein